MNHADRRRAALAAACACGLLIAGLLIAGCGSATRHVTSSSASTGVATINTRTGSLQSVALTGTSTDVASTVTGATATVTGATSTLTGETTTDLTGTGTIAEGNGIGVTSGGIASLGRPFAADSPWNTTVTNSPIASNSAKLIQLAKERFSVTSGNSVENIQTGLLGATGTANDDQNRGLSTTLFINTTIWTDPIVVSDGGNNVNVVCRQVNLPPPNNECGDGWQVSSLSIPTTGFPKPAYDGWLTVIDQNSGYAYDLWRARLSGSVLTYQFMRRWTLDGPGFLGPSEVSARGSGLPMFAGEILPKDIMSGHIHHALSISIPGPASRFYAQPASASDGNGAYNSVPEGARLRLKASFNVNYALRHLPGGVSVSSARAILTALRTYGAIVVDRSAVPTLYAVPNFDWSQLLRNSRGQLLSPNGKTVLPPAYQNKIYGTQLLAPAAISFLKLDDFNVIQLPLLYEFPPPNSVKQTGGYNGVAPQAVQGNAAGSSALSATGGGSAAGSTGVGTAVP
jgi:hypothetical protein